MKRGIVWTLLIALVGVGGVSVSQAATFNSSNFSVNGSLGDSAAGGQSSTNYKLVSSAGESIVGNGSSGSYKLGQGYTPKLEQSLQLNVQPTAQVAYYPLDENTATAVWDVTTNNNDGNFAGTPTWATGKLGSALTVSSSNYVSVPDDASFSVGSSSVTMMAWVNLSGLGTSGSIISQNGDSFELNKDSSNRLGVQMTCSDSTLRRARESTASLTATGAWYHVAAVFDPTSGATSIYVNGSSRTVTYIDAQSACPSGLKNSTSPVTLGSRDTGANPFSGTIDEIKFFSRAFTTKEITAEYTAQSKGIASAVSLSNITPGTSQTSNFDTIVQTDAASYNLAINQNHDMRNGGNGEPDFAQDFNAFGNGTTLTTGNTGFDNLFSSGTGTFTSSTSSTIHGTFGRFSTTTSSTDFAREQYADTSSRFYRFYMRLSSLPAATATVFSLLDNAGTTTVGALRVQTDGTILLRNGAVTVDTSTTALNINEWMRIELFYNAAASVQTAKLYAGANVNSTTPTETLTGAATNGATSYMNIGMVTSQASQTYDIDEVETSTVTWLGPPSTASIPAVSSSIASPAAWSEGTTKGLGFSLSAAVGLDSKWGSGANYAAFPLSGTTFYSRSGYTGGTKDVIAMRVRADVNASQVAGDYENAVTIPGRFVP